MSDIKRMDRDAAQEMANELKYTAEELTEMIAAMQQVAERMENGALLGRGGEAFSAALRQRFCQALERLAEKLRLEAAYVETEILDDIEAEREARSLF